MKILKLLFICGSLEPGRDGVGDYTRRLAGQLVKKGHQVTLMAYRDRNVSSVWEGNQQSEGAEILALRIPYCNSSEARISHAKRWVTSNNPEWISLQYVPYSFHDKGLPWSLDKELLIIGKGKKWHIMFHELWVGMEQESSLKTRTIGSLQQFLIMKAINNLKPQVVHTQSSFYQMKLEQKGYKTSFLPLFSNIPRLSFPSKRNAETLSFVSFGSIQPGAPISQFTSELEALSKKRDKRIEFTFIGNSGNELESWVSACKAKGFSVNILGEQRSEKISEVLHGADWGLSSTPYFQSEKSGTIAAMLDHMLPVYCVSRSWTPRKVMEVQLQDGVVAYVPEKLEMDPRPIKERINNQLNSICNLFLKSLTR